MFQIIVRDLINGSSEMYMFDAVFCCNGHYSCPRIPEYLGQHLYKGKILHSHSFRTADTFKGIIDSTFFTNLAINAIILGETVLVIGGGASGIDIACFMSKVANKTTISYHDPTKAIPDGIYKKPDVKELTENGVIFEDGTREDFSVIMLCTGYFEFLEIIVVNCK